MTETSEDSNSNQVSSINSEQLKSATNEPKQHTKIKTL